MLNVPLEMNVYRIPDIQALARKMPSQEAPPPPPYTKEDPRKTKVNIAVMGPTGSGKSTFINLISGSSLAASGALASCTQEVQLADNFKLDGRVVSLIDTPGFDDTDRTDAEILNNLASFLKTEYEKGTILHGVIYFHRISDNRMGGFSVRNFKLFRTLCGEATLRNVIILTSMWDQVALKEGEEREKQLRENPKYYQIAVQSGARMFRHDNTLPSAKAVIRAIFENHPLPLSLQQEMVDQGKDITQTAAGQEVNRELNDMIRRHEAEIDSLKAELKTYQRENEMLRNIVEEKIANLEEDRAKAIAEAQNMSANYAKENERVKRELEKVRRRLEVMEMKRNYDLDENDISIGESPRPHPRDCQCFACTTRHVSSPSVNVRARPLVYRVRPSQPPSLNGCRCAVCIKKRQHNAA